MGELEQELIAVQQAGLQASLEAQTAESKLVQARRASASASHGCDASGCIRRHSVRVAQVVEELAARDAERAESESGLAQLVEAQQAELQARCCVDMIPRSGLRAWRVQCE